MEILIITFVSGYALGVLIARIGFAHALVKIDKDLSEAKRRKTIKDLYPKNTSGD